MFNKLYAAVLNLSFCLFLTILTVFLSSCKADLDGNDNWLGLWTAHKQGQVYFFDISDENGASSFEIVDQKVVFGTVKIDQQQKTITLSDTSFSICGFPQKTQNAPKWQMCVDGLWFTKN